MATGLRIDLTLKKALPINMSDEPKHDRAKFNGMWLAVGVGVGTAIGAAVKNVALGVALGASIGVSLAFAVPLKKK
jgi:hypothetical protein